MAYSSTSSNSEVSTDSNCSSSCLENVKILKERNEQLLKDLRTSKLNTIAYKTGLESVEARLLVYKKNESVYEEDIKLLKCLGYNVVPPPYTGNFMPPKHDLPGLEEFVNEPIVNEPTVKKSVVETSEAKASADKPKVVRKNNGAPIIEDWVSDSEEEDMPQAKKEKKTVKSSFAKIKFVKSKEQVKSPRKTTVKQGNQNRLNTHSPRGNQRNWNNMMSQRLGSNFEMINKACYVCGSFDHLQYDCDYHQRQFNNKKMVKLVWNYTQRVNHQNFSRMTHPSPKRNMVPKAVLMRSGLVSLTTARPVNTAQPRTTVNSARPMINVFNKAHSAVKRAINKKTATKNSNFNKRVNTVSGMNVNTARPKAVVNATRGLTPFTRIAREREHVLFLIDFEEILFEGDVAFRSLKSYPDAGFKPSGDNEKKVTEDLKRRCSTVNAAGIEVNDVGAKTSIELPDDPNMPELEDIVYSDNDENVGAKADMNNLNTFMHVSPILTTRIHKDHPVEQIIGDLNLAP
ncbi:hypothetical protein Tco_0012781 [Tanacetum coccineum]